MADEDRLYFLEDIDLYGKPDNNPALAEILLGERLTGIIAEYTSQVAANYVQRLGDRPRKGDQHPGRLASSVRAGVRIGGNRHDRVIGEVVVGAEYAAADEFGRHAYADYEGSHDLRAALYNVLPHRI